jgi:hypothetical protein
MFLTRPDRISKYTLGFEVLPLSSLQRLVGADRYTGAAADGHACPTAGGYASAAADESAANGPTAAGHPGAAAH